MKLEWGNEKKALYIKIIYTFLTDKYPEQQIDKFI